MPLKMSHLFGGILGGICFGLMSGLLLGSCVFKAGPNHQAASGLSAPAPQAMQPAGANAAVPGGMDPGSGVMEAVFAKVGELKETVDKDPTNRAALIELANLFYDANKCDKAVVYYEKALAIQRDDPNVLTDAAYCYWIAGNTDKALDMFREVRSKFPAHWQSAVNLFFLAASRKDAALAGESLEQVRRLNPTFQKLPAMEKMYEDLNRGGRS